MRSVVSGSRLVPFVVGVAGGAAFGVAFGAVASVFEGGPPLVTGIAESWWWFAALGAFFSLAPSRRGLR